MRVSHLTLGGLLLAGVATGQDDPRPNETDAEARLQALSEEVQSVVSAWAAKREEPDSPKSPDLKPLVAKYLAAAEEFAGTDDAVPFLAWLIQSARFDEDAAAAAANTLATNHAASSRIVEMANWFGYLDRMIDADAAKALMTAIREQNKDPDVQGWLALADHRASIDTAALESDDYKTAKVTLLAHAEKVTNEGLKSEIESLIEVREKFGVGQPAPDIAGVDLDGVEFKLSDYKGKVVFLDFWGDW